MCIRDSDNSIRGNVDYALGDNGILYLGAEYRKGDIVSTGPVSYTHLRAHETVLDLVCRLLLEKTPPPPPPP